MRRRLLLATVGTVAVGVVLLGLPLAFAMRLTLLGSSLDALQGQAEQVQVLINSEAMSAAEVRQQLDRLAAESDLRFQLVGRSGNRGLVLDTGGPPTVPADFTEDLESAFGGEVGQARGPGVLAVAVPLRTGQFSQILRAVSSDEDYRRQLGAAWLSIAGLGVTALGLAGLVGLMLARRLAEPMESLAEAAAQLGEGDFTARAPRTGIPESDQVATALDITADRLGTMVERSRSFGADASHQLRTPLTALRLDLEALELAGADEALLGAAFTEADRLEATIEELLALADVPMGDEHLQLAALVDDRIDSWRAVAQAADRDVLVDAQDVPAVRARAAAIGQCLQVLLDNALVHGHGTITIRIAEAARPAATGREWVRLCVSDEGSGFEEDATPGRGLRLAKSLIQGEGGRIRVERDATVCLLLPAVPPEHLSFMTAPEGIR
ncbi:sensor histidine kinase [Euzebya tangerina]|uniref:sensor histidine kinase n=1 Tax=Euzebya tangerina TaxID=591198 RepID=UPI000E313143|nr:HAMP domain-containing sensor histidine kinase [Euzebya tangerina]